MTDDEWFAELVRSGQAALDRTPNNIPRAAAAEPAPPPTRCDTLHLGG